MRPSVGGAAFPTDPAVAVPAGRFNRMPVLLGQAGSERSLFTFQNCDYLGKPLTAEQHVALVTSTYGAKAAKVLTEYPVRCSATSTRTTLTSRHDLAYAYRSAGRVAEVITLFEQVLTDRMRVLDPDHPDTLATRHNLCRRIRTAGRVAEAIDLYAGKDQRNRWRTRSSGRGASHHLSDGSGSFSYAANSSPHASWWQPGVKVKGAMSASRL